MAMNRGSTDEVLDSSGDSGVVGLQCIECFLQTTWNKLAMTEMVKLHDNNGPVNLFDGRRIANGSFDPFA